MDIIYTIKESSLTNLCDAVREQEDSVEKIPFSEIAPRIRNIVKEAHGDITNGDLLEY